MVFRVTTLLSVSARTWWSVRPTPTPTSPNSPAWANVSGCVRSSVVVSYGKTCLVCLNVEDSDAWHAGERTEGGRGGLDILFGCSWVMGTQALTIRATLTCCTIYLHRRAQWRAEKPILRHSFSFLFFFFLPPDQGDSITIFSGLSLLAYCGIPPNAMSLYVSQFRSFSHLSLMPNALSHLFHLLPRLTESSRSKAGFNFRSSKVSEYYNLLYRRQTKHCKKSFDKCGKELTHCIYFKLVFIGFIPHLIWFQG